MGEGEMTPMTLARRRAREAIVKMIRATCKQYGYKISSYSVSQINKSARWLAENDPKYLRNAKRRIAKERA
jgi:hypothetical protein